MKQNLVSKDLQISVFLPAYNEQENIQNTVNLVDKTLKKLTQVYEIIVVNDGSRDETGEKVKELAKKNTKIRLINHSKNKGYGAAIKSGLYAARYPWIVQMDSDGQFDFTQIEKFLPKTSQADMIVGFRLHRTDSFYRRLMAKILWLADFILFGLNVKDVDCGFKLFKKKILETIPRLKTESAITITEFVARTKASGFTIEQVGVNHYSRKVGEQTGGKPSIIFKAAWQGILLWFWFLKEKIWK